MIYTKSSSFFFNLMDQQTSKYLMLIRPRNFSSNEETLASNDFLHGFNESSNLSEIRENVDTEFTNMINHLSQHDIEHIVFDDIKGSGSPDAIFPNNWITFHEEGIVVLYPMMSSKRRNERRLSDQYFYKKIYLIENQLAQANLKNNHQVVLKILLIH